MVTTERERLQAPPLRVDEGFPSRVTRTSILLSAIATVFLFLWESGRAAAGVLERHAISIGFACGATIIISVIALWSWTARAIVRAPEEGKPRGRALLFLIQLVKVPLVLAAMWASWRYLKVNLFALAAGLGIWFLVAALKVAAIWMLSSQVQRK